MKKIIFLAVAAVLLGVAAETPAQEARGEQEWDWRLENEAHQCAWRILLSLGQSKEGFDQTGNLVIAELPFWSQYQEPSKQMAGVVSRILWGFPIPLGNPFSISV